MLLKKVITSGLVSALAMGSLVPLSSAASARDFGRHGGGHYRPHHDAPRYHGYANRWDGHRRHRDHTGRNIAIGAFAAILGLALAAESQRVGRDYYDERD